MCRRGREAGSRSGPWATPSRARAGGGGVNSGNVLGSRAVEAQPAAVAHWRAVAAGGDPVESFPLVNIWATAIVRRRRWLPPVCLSACLPAWPRPAGAPGRIFVTAAVEFP